MNISKETIGKNYVLLRPNRRGQVRHLLVEKVTEGIGSTFLGYAKNISYGGIFISTATPKPVDTLLAISFLIPDTEIVISCDTRVSWVCEFDPEKRVNPGMGLEFKNLDKESRQEIDKWISNKEKEDSSF